MTKNKQLNNQSGFTIIEVLIVLIVIGIFVGLVFTTFGDFKRKSRNSERQNDIKAIQQSIENYYSQNETYPTLTQINDPSWRGKNLKNLQNDQITDPQGNGAGLSSVPIAGAYGYQPKADNGDICDNSKIDCRKYTLTATQEGDVEFIKNNYN